MTQYNSTVHTVTQTAVCVKYIFCIFFSVRLGRQQDHADSDRDLSKHFETELKVNALLVVYVISLFN